MDVIIAQIFSAVLLGHRNEVVIHVKTAFKQGISASLIMNNGMIAAMREVGDRFEAGEYYVPEMLVAARAMQAGLDILRPFLADKEAHPAGVVAIGTVEGDMHDIGKNLVKMMLEGSGFEVIDLGVDVSPMMFVNAVCKHSVDILAISALITTTMQNMPLVIHELEKSSLRKNVKVMIGGAPVTEEFALQIGADGYAPDASRAATLAKSLMTR